MRVRQVQGAPVGAECHPVRGDQAISYNRQVARCVITINTAHTRGCRHVDQHGARQKAALPVASSVVKAHACLCMIHPGQQAGMQRAINLWCQLKHTGFHARHPTAFIAHGCNTAQHLGRLPLAGPARCGSPAVELSRGDIHPVQGLLVGLPNGAFTDTASAIDNKFCLTCHHSPNGPALTKGPPW